MSIRIRHCNRCGEDISDRPNHHYLCYDCWKNKDETDDEEPKSDWLIDDFKPSFSRRYNPWTNSMEMVNETYEERYKGTEDDMGPHWDYDEYPPENL